MLKGLAEAAKVIKAAQQERDGIAAAGARAFMLGIELRDNPRRQPTERKIWGEGYASKQRWFSALLQRWKSL